MKQQWVVIIHYHDDDDVVIGPFDNRNDAIKFYDMQEHNSYAEMEIVVLTNPEQW